MVSIVEVPTAEFIARLKEELKKIEELKPPVWINFVKSGSHKERPPEQPDFWYIRTASVLRRIYLEGPVGISRLRTFYGGRKHRGYKPDAYRRSGGNILRKVLQQLEKVGFVVKDKKGRKMTPKGQKFLNGIAKEIKKK